MKRKILIRIDDICPTMDFKMFERACQLLDSVGAKPLLGVIPNCHDSNLQIEKPREDFWQYIQCLKNRGYSIAMHGYTHVYDTNVRGRVQMRFCSEFAGHSYQEQYGKLAKGKKIMEEHGCSTDVFFAPAHSYDEVTLQALNANGFHYISDGMSLKPYILHGIKCIPCRSLGIPKISGEGCYTVVLHCHEWKRSNSNSYRRLEELCSKYANQIVSWKEYIDQPIGLLQMQLAVEWSYVRWRRYIILPLAKAYYNLRGE